METFNFGDQQSPRVSPALFNRAVGRRTVLKGAGLVAASTGLASAWALTGRPGSSLFDLAAPGARAATGRALVLYDGGGDPARATIARGFADKLADLLARYGFSGASLAVKKLSDYVAGDISGSQVTFYIGSQYSDAPLNPAFLADAASAVRPVIWMKYNFHQLIWARPANTFGLTWVGPEFLPDHIGIYYKNHIYYKYCASDSEFSVVSISDPTKATRIAYANSFVGDPGAAVPYIVRSGNLYFVADNPLADIVENDRYLAFCDLLWDVLGAHFATTLSLSDFKRVDIPAGSLIWFNMVGKLPGKQRGSATALAFRHQRITINDGTSQIVVPVPDAAVLLGSAYSSPSTVFDQQSQTWVTRADPDGGDDCFLGGAALPLPQGLPGKIRIVTWSADVRSSTPGLILSWKWGAAAYSRLSTPPGSPVAYPALAVKPLDGKKGGVDNSDKAGSPEAFRDFVIKGAKGDGGKNYTGDQSPDIKVLCAT